MKGPLNEISVVELGTYVAAPALGSMLGMLGASVVKVEPVEGDPTRKLTPWSWVNYNWNKKSVTLDLKSKEGMRCMRALLGSADVFIESLSPRAIKELALTYGDVRRSNRRIVYCSIKGFGSDSSSSQRIGFDTIAQAVGGLMSVSGRGTRPSRVGNPCVDLSAAAFGAVGILSSLLARPRKAAYIEIPLVDVVVYWNGYWLPYMDLKGKEPSNLGDAHPGFSPYGVFAAEDGFVFIGALTDAHWKRLVASLGIDPDPGLSQMKARVARREEVNSLVERAVKRVSTSDLLSLLGNSVPFAKVNTLMDVYSDTELRKRDVVRKVPVDGKLASVALPPFIRNFVRKGDLGRPRRAGADNRIVAALSDGVEPTQSRQSRSRSRK